MNTTTASDTTTETTTPMHRRFGRLLAVGGFAAALALGAAACSSGSGSSNAAKTAAKTPSGVVPAGFQTPAPAAQPGQASPAPGSPSGSQGGTQSGGTATPPPSAPAPTITSFTTPDNIDCHNGNFQTFSASWTTQNAVRTTISIDGPGVYSTYDANASVSLPFNCSSSHTFLLTAYGADGHTATQSVTLAPRNVQTTNPNP